MDPITAAIPADLPALASDMVKSTVKDAYEGLKAVIRRKWGDTSPISKAISAMEEDPKIQGPVGRARRKGQCRRGDRGCQGVQALRQLVEQMKMHGIRGETVAKIQFNMNGGVVQGVAGAENAQIGSINIGAPPKG